MKNLVLASAMAIASVFSFAAPSMAQSVTVTTTERAAPRYMQRHAQRYEHRRVQQDCRVKRVKTIRHGQTVIKETRVCR